MDRKQKIITGILWSVLIVVMVGVVGTGLWARKRDEAANALPRLFHVPQFSLIDQDARPVTDAQLRGKPWVAAFIFTQCAGDCPMMSRRFQSLQKATDGSEVRLVSFTVDPQRDTPAVLKAYAQRFNAQQGRWMFLTGTQEQMLSTAAEMKISAVPATATQPILHADFLLLVDGEGWVRGVYRSKDDETEKKLAADALALARQQGRFP